MRLLLLAVALTMAACNSEAPVPEDAVPLRDDVYVQELHRGVWRHVSFRWYPATGPFPSNGLIVRSERGAILVDTAWNPEQTSAILDWLDQNVGPVQAVIVTHAHDDRMGGLSEVHRRGVPSVALQATAELAVESGGPLIQRPVPSGFRLEPFGVRGEIFFPGKGHTSDNAVVFLEDSHVLAGTCMVREASAKTLGNTKQADLVSWPDAIQQLQRRYPRAELVVPGHGSPGGRELLQHTLSLLESRQERAGP